MPRIKQPRLTRKAYNGIDYLLSASAVHVKAWTEAGYLEKHDLDCYAAITEYLNQLRVAHEATYEPVRARRRVTGLQGNEVMQRKRQSRDSG